jgi:hypothetical protein
VALPRYKVRISVKYKEMVESASKIKNVKIDKM